MTQTQEAKADAVLALCIAEQDLVVATDALRQIESMGRKASQAARDTAHASVARLTTLVATLTDSFTAACDADTAIASVSDAAGVLAVAERIIAAAVTVTRSQAVPALTVTYEQAHDPRAQRFATKQSGACIGCHVYRPEIAIDAEPIVCRACAFDLTQRADFPSWEPIERRTIIEGLNRVTGSTPVTVAKAVAPMPNRAFDVPGHVTRNDVSRPAAVETAAARLDRLAKKAVIEGVQFVREARSGAYFATSGTNTTVIYALDLGARTCTCRGYEINRVCKHVALLVMTAPALDASIAS